MKEFSFTTEAQWLLSFHWQNNILGLLEAEHDLYTISLSI